MNTANLNQDFDSVSEALHITNRALSLTDVIIKDLEIGGCRTSDHEAYCSEKVLATLIETQDLAREILCSIDSLHESSNLDLG